jgi:CheY-like chemotaxis protein
VATSVRLLVACADAPIRNLVHLVFDGPDVEVREAVDTRQTSEVVASFRPDVLLLDARLPDVGGAAVARALRARPETAGTRIVALTHLAEPAGEDLLGVVDDVLARPFGVFSLFAAVDRLQIAR